jgi:hypothetical protein
VRLELMGHDNPALNALGMGASAIEVIEGFNVEISRKPARQPLKCGRSGAITRIGRIFSRPVPLLLRVAAAVAGPRRSRQLRRIAACLQHRGLDVHSHRVAAGRSCLRQRPAVAAANQHARDRINV